MCTPPTRVSLEGRTFWGILVAFWGAACRVAACTVAGSGAACTVAWIGLYGMGDDALLDGGGETDL
jgi:hypothetical protein